MLCMWQRCQETKAKNEDWKRITNKSSYICGNIENSFEKSQTMGTHK